jgi:hypothetical protein
MFCLIFLLFVYKIFATEAQALSPIDTSTSETATLNDYRHSKIALSSSDTSVGETLAEFTDFITKSSSSLDSRLILFYLIIVIFIIIIMCMIIVGLFIWYRKCTCLACCDKNKFYMGFIDEV